VVTEFNVERDPDGSGARGLVDGLAGTSLERRLVADLALFSSPSSGLDGAAIYRTALADVGQPAPRGAAADPNR